MMATVRDIENRICQIITEIVYPPSLAGQSIVAYPFAGFNSDASGFNIFANNSQGMYMSGAITGSVNVKISAGFPIQEQLNRDVLNGQPQISVFPIAGTDKNTTRMRRVYQDYSFDPQTLSVSVLANQITIIGTPLLPVSVLVSLDKQNYGYIVNSGDTTATIATALASLIPGATASGNVVTVTNPINLSAKVIRTGKALKESKRQIKLFYVSVFTPTPDMRDLLSDAVDVVLGDIIRIDFPMGDEALITYKGLVEFDKFELNIIYRRDLIYTVEYPTTIESTFYEIGAEEINITQTI